MIFILVIIKLNIFFNIINSGADCVILNFLDTAPSRASLLHIPRLKRAAPKMRIGLVLWQSNSATGEATVVAAGKLAEIKEIGADFCATSFADALRLAFQDEPALPPMQHTKKPRGSVRPIPVIAEFANQSA